MNTKNSTYSILNEVLEHIQILNKLDEQLQENPERDLEKFWQAQGQASLMNAGTLLISLYGLVVFPWERLRKQFRKSPTLKKTRLDDWCRYRIFNLAPAMQRKPLPLYFVLELMRNAISHADVKIDEALRITFRERKGTVIAFEYKELKKFLEHLVVFYHSGELDLFPKGIPSGSDV